MSQGDDASPTSTGHQPDDLYAPRLSEVADLLGPLAFLPELQSPPGEPDRPTTAWTAHCKAADAAPGSISQVREDVILSRSPAQTAKADVLGGASLFSQTLWPEPQNQPLQPQPHQLTFPDGCLYPHISQPGQSKSWLPWDFAWEPFQPETATTPGPPAEAQIPSEQPQRRSQPPAPKTQATISEEDTTFHKPATKHNIPHHLPWSASQYPQGFTYQGPLQNKENPLYLQRSVPLPPMVWTMPPYSFVSQPPSVLHGQSLNTEPPLTQASRVHRRIHRPEQHRDRGQQAYPSGSKGDSQVRNLSP